MHNYSISSTKIRITTISIIAIIAAYITFLLNPYIRGLNTIIRHLSPFIVFGILFFIFDKWLWKIWPISSCLRVPNFNGTWEGKCKSTSDKANGKVIDTEIKITQTFTKLVVDANFNSSNSESFVANIDYKNPHRPKLIYSYLNFPHGDSVSTQDKHLGTVEINLKNDKELIGNYFTDRQPQTKGSFTLKKPINNKH